MDRYTAFLRGINISGKNKIAMPDLKKVLEGMNFYDVSTFLNSGNVLFSSDNGDSIDIKKQMEAMIDKEFALEIPVHIIRYDYLKEILENAPQWWGTDDKDKYHNLIFIMTSDTPEQICDLAGAPSDGLEMIQTYKNVIYWTFDRKQYQKCNWWKKTACAGIAEKLTVRTANTLRKLCRQ